MRVLRYLSRSEGGPRLTERGAAGNVIGSTSTKTETQKPRVTGTNDAVVAVPVEIRRETETNAVTDATGSKERPQR